jgi:hypothetical protein
MCRPRQVDSLITRVNRRQEYNSLAAGVVEAVAPARAKDSQRCWLQILTGSSLHTVYNQFAR